jgi:FkbM family methyltransferase
MTYHSQYRQDQFLREHLLPQNDGFFVEVGADDGVDRSNTLAFEQAGWSGICIEPSPSRFDALLRNRRCECLNVAIASIEERAEFLDIVGYGKGLSGLVCHYDPRHVERIERETAANPLTVSRSRVTVPARRLDTILAERGVRTVNYCSIDVEGSELDVLRSIDFDTVSFDVITVEDNYGEPAVRRYLEERGFRLVTVAGQDLVYAREGLASG